MSEKQREHFYINKDDMDYIYSCGSEYKLNKSKSLELIINEHREYKNNIKKNKYKDLINELSNELGDSFSKLKSSIKFTDTNVQILIELVNCLLINLGKESDTIVGTDDLKSPMLELAQKEVNNRIYKNFYKKNGDVK